ncbi:porin [Herbaspirillum rubrisubalbicans]|uniref:porin n=1 Tax=Herbaspirillum rubrisubalbicans TaxID=80842 RepID=UPI001559F77B|nr:porin [Herbaspirillum rubrisubalbicans]
MKKSAIGLACLGIVGTAYAQSSVEIYGVATAGLGYVDKVATTGSNTGSRVGIDSGQYTQSRIGFRGAEDLGGGNKAEFVIEGGFTLDNGASTQNGATFGRRTTVGLSGDYGDIQLGRRKDYTDFIANQYSTASRMLPFTGKAHGNNLDRATGERANNMIYYTTPNYGGFQANLTYAFGEAAGSNSTGQSLGLGANYDNGPFGIGLAYWQSKKAATVGSASTNTSSDQGAASNAGCNTATLGNAGDTCTKVWMLGTNYDIGPVTLRGTYSLVKQPLVNASSGTAANFVRTVSATSGSAAFTAGGINNSRADIYDVGADYKMGNWLFKGSVIYSRYDFVGASNKGKLTTFVLGADYSLSKRSLLYAMLANMRASDMYSPGLTSNGAPGADKSQNALALGILHRF